MTAIENIYSTLDRFSCPLAGENRPPLQVTTMTPDKLLLIMAETWSIDQLMGWLDDEFEIDDKGFQWAAGGLELRYYGDKRKLDFAEEILMRFGADYMRMPSYVEVRIGAKAGRYGAAELVLGKIEK